jgi:hypothetical protein
MGAVLVGRESRNNSKLVIPAKVGIQFFFLLGKIRANF